MAVREEETLKIARSRRNSSTTQVPFWNELLAENGIMTQLFGHLLDSEVVAIFIRWRVFDELSSVSTSFYCIEHYLPFGMLSYSAI